MLMNINRDRLLNLSYKKRSLVHEEHLFFYESFEDFKSQFNVDEISIIEKVYRDKINIRLIVIIRSKGMVPFERIYKKSDLDKQYGLD